MERKQGYNWRLIFKGPEVEYCTAMKFQNLFPFYAKDLRILEKALGGNATLDCPLQPGPYFIMNYTDTVNVDKTGMSDDKKLGVGVIIPNGRYRFTVKFFTKKDPLAFYLQWHTEINDRLTQDDF
jgi:hypothetical protein